VHGPQNTPILRRCIIAGTKERFEGHKHPQPPPKYIRKHGGLSPIYLTHRHGAPGLMWGAREAYPPAAAMVVAVVTPVVFCDKANEKRNKNTKINWFLPKCYFITIYCKTYCDSHIANCSVVEPELWRGRSPNHFGPMDPGILGIAGKLFSLRERLTHWNEG
jgi:hypothetical protein